MAPGLMHLPNGNRVSVRPIFGGFRFEAQDLNLHHSPFPPGWILVLHTEEDGCEDATVDGDDEGDDLPRVHRYKKPTLRNDVMYISSVSNPSNNDFKPSVSPTRVIAKLLWATLWWYFHQPRPAPQLAAAADNRTPEAGRPKIDWRVRIKREGLFKGRNLLSKLERMGLIATEQSFVGTDYDERSNEGWSEMFVSQRAFWQLDARIFLFSVAPTAHSPFPAQSPYGSRPSSPNRQVGPPSPRHYHEGSDNNIGLWSPSTPGPFQSTSHLPTFYPPAPTQYTLTNNIRHPIRPKPPRQGETFYTRYVPSVGQYLSFRVASLSPKTVMYNGPVASNPPAPAGTSYAGSHASVASIASIASIALGPSDTDLLHNWMNKERVSEHWGADGPREQQEAFLARVLSSKHSFPAIGCWDGRPFGYFEIYWVKEDVLGRHSDAGHWDRGFHALVGEEEFRGRDRVMVWLTAMAHYCWLADQRTDRVFLEPRVDNVKFINYLQEAGFYKEREIALPHKQAALMKMGRDAWEGPVL